MRCSMKGNIIADEFNKMVWIRDKEGKEYACTLGALKNIKKFEDMTEEEKKQCMDLSVVLGDSW
jgi:hypothetical protein